MSDSFSKIAIALSCIALGVAGASFFMPKKTNFAESDDLELEKAVTRIFQNKPQVLLDVINNAVASKNKEAAAQICNDVFAQKEELKNIAICIGNKDAKKVIIAFSDPLCPHCKTFQQEIARRVELDKDLCVYLLPVAAISNDSVAIAQLYFAVYEKTPLKITTFMRAIAEMKVVNNEGITQLLKSVNLKQSDVESLIAEMKVVNNEGITQLLKSVNLKQSDVESLLENCREKIARCGMMAEKLGIPVVPAIFAIGKHTAKMLQPGQNFDINDLFADIL